MAVCAGLGAFDYWRDTKHDGSTWSEVTRATFHTETRAGRAAFTLTLIGGSALYWKHILKH